MARKSQFYLPNPTTGTQELHHFETELSQIADIVRLPSTTYASGDIAYCHADNFPVGWWLECTTAGTTGAGELTFTSAPGVGSNVADGTVTWTVRKPANTANLNGFAPGDIKPIAYNGTVQDGWLLCDGSAVSRSTYSSLYSAIGTIWGSGDGSSTFNLPNLNGYWLKGSSSSGSSLNAGLPNITGELHPGVHSQIAGFGDKSTSIGSLIATNAGTTGYIFTNSSSGQTQYKLVLNASKSSSIYGTATTVQPASKTVRFVIKY